MSEMTGAFSGVGVFLALGSPLHVLDGIRSGHLLAEACHVTVS